MEADNFAEFIRPLERRMFDTVWKVLRHAQDAEDALQNALTTIWKERSRILHHAAPQGLILKICADAAIDHYRKRKKVNRFADSLDESLNSVRQSPVDELIQRETTDLLMDAIAQLSQNQSSSVVMYYIQRESVKTISAALGCGEETVREHLARGKERLSRVLRAVGP